MSDEVVGWLGLLHTIVPSPSEEYPIGIAPSVIAMRLSNMV